MDKIKALPLVLFTIATIKMLIMGSTLTDGLSLLILAATSMYFQFHTTNAELDKIHEEMDKTKEDLKNLAKEQEAVKTHVAGLKIGQQMRNVNVR